MNKPDKGLYNGSCNRTACQVAGARWWNVITQAYYCAYCADQINRYNTSYCQETNSIVLCVDDHHKAHPNYQASIYLEQVSDPAVLEKMPLEHLMAAAQLLCANNSDLIGESVTVEPVAVEPTPAKTLIGFAQLHGVNIPSRFRPRPKKVPTTPEDHRRIQAAKEKRSRKAGK